MNVADPTTVPTVSPWMSGSYNSPARLKPTSFDLNWNVSDHGPFAVPCTARARQENSVHGWRSASGVQLVFPLAPSGTAVLPTWASKPDTVDAVVAAVKL